MKPSIPQKAKNFLIYVIILKKDIATLINAVIQYVSQNVS